GEKQHIVAPPMRVVGYLASWAVRGKGVSIAGLPAKHLTHIFYAFAQIAKDGSVALGDRCLDVGACGKAASLPARPGGNFGELRRGLDAQGTRDNRHYELTIAASARPSEIANLQVDRIVPLLDFINVMTYDYHTGGKIAHFNAPLYAAPNDPTPDLTIDSTMHVFRNAGVASDKLLIGIPFFSRAYGGVANVNAGFLQPAPSPPKNWRDSDGGWRQLAATTLRDPRYTRHWEPTARVPWLYDAANGNWISYDDP